MNDYPQIEIFDERVKLTVMLPDAAEGFYRGTRFDWSGQIVRAECGGHSYFAPWRLPHDPTNNECAAGPAEELAKNNPLGYADAAPGETFIKPGVGLLVRDEADYLFSNDYEIAKCGQWEVSSGDGWIEFAQQLAGPNGWAYSYVKRIEIATDAPGFVIGHRMTNTGRKRIDILHYNHNFTIIDDAPISDAYELELPFEIGLSTKPNDLYRIDGRRFAIARELGEKDIVWAVLQGFGDSAADNAGVIRNTATGAGLRFKGDLPCIEYYVYGERTCICPEPLVRIEIDPGADKTWDIDYEFIM